MIRKYVLAINPGSTSTKLSIFHGEKEFKSHKIEHKGLEEYSQIIDQFDYRLGLILEWLRVEKIDLKELVAVVGRGGLLRPIPCGIYLVDDFMIDDLKVGINGQHASNLGGLLAKGIADLEGQDAYIVDPVSVDEFEPVSRISGYNEISRISLVHALNIKAVVHRFERENGKNAEDLNLIVAHLGGGISIAPIEKGRIIDVNNANQGGPFSPERTGTLPCGDLIQMCYSNKYSLNDMRTMITGKGGLFSYLGTYDAKEVMSRIMQGDEYAKLIYDSMAYQIGKEIVSMAVVLKGKVDKILITGGLANDKYLLDKILEMISFVSEVEIYPGEDEMEALNEGVLRVLSHIEEPKNYREEVESWQKILASC